MEELKELLKQLNEIVEGNQTVDDEAKAEAKDLINNANTTILVATDNGCGYIGTATKIISCWATLTLELMNKVDIDGELIKKAFDVAYSLKDLDEDEQCKQLAKMAFEAQSKTKSKEELAEEKASIKDRLKEIDKELKELDKED